MSARPVSASMRPAARLVVRKRFSPLAAMLPIARLVLTVGLVVTLVIASVRYFSNPPEAGALQFTAHIVGKTGESVGVLGLQVGDVTGDGKADVVAAGTGGIAVYAQGSKYSFKKTVIDGVSSTRIQLIDFDNDGALDILASLKNSPGVKWYHNDGNLTFTGHGLASSGPGVAAAADFDRDGNKDIATAINEGGEVVLKRWMGNGHGSFTEFTLATNTGVVAMTTGDVNGNKYSDIVTGGTLGLQRWDSNNGTTWNRVDIDSDFENKSNIRIYDINQDNKTDIITADQNKNATAYYRNVDNGAYQRIVVDGDTDAASAIPVDVDSDGKVDIVTATQDDSTVFWYENQGSDSFTQRVLVSGLQSVYDAVVVDINGDKNLDVVAGDHFRGNLYWYERVRARPEASEPASIKQSTGGRGLITFDTIVSSDDFNPTRMRVQYSLDGVTWHKPYLTSVSATVGSADVQNSNQYQIGSNNPIDTNETDDVQLTVTWDTKSVQNSGGPIVGNVSGVRLRVTPRDSIVVGDTTQSEPFRVDNGGPTGLTNVKVVATGMNEARLSWQPPTDSSLFSFSVYYGTNINAVSEKQGKVWGKDQDENLGDIESTGTTITGLDPTTTYAFKVFVTDVYGNESAASAVQGTTTASGSLPSATPTPSETAAPTSSPGLFPTPTPDGGEEPSRSPTPRPSPTPPPTTFENRAPRADAGPDQLVNPNALVILDGTASNDQDGDALTYVWRQLSGPQAELLSSRTATPSFSAGGENQTYIFALTVRDPKGASSTDMVTVATRALPAGNTVPSDVDRGSQTEPVIEEISFTELLLSPLDYMLFVFAILATIISVVDRASRKIAETPALAAQDSGVPKGKIVHYKSGEPIAGAQVMVYGADGKLRTTLRTNLKGEFETLFPAGQYTISVQVEGFAFAPAATSVLRPENGILYTGGTLTVQDPSKPVSLTIPMKPTGEEVGAARVRLLQVWQTVQRWGRVFSWPIFLAGTLLNTALIFLHPGITYLVIEVLYVVLVIVKVALEIRVRPAYGLVRDAITHVPLDLAVVRLYEEGTNRLIMTRVTNNQGKFFALPPAGTYTVTVTKPGYAAFSKQHVSITAEQDSVLQITTDLMPVTPQLGLSAARAAVL